MSTLKQKGMDLTWFTTMEDRAKWAGMGTIRGLLTTTIIPNTPSGMRVTPLASSGEARSKLWTALWTSQLRETGAVLNIPKDTGLMSTMNYSRNSKKIWKNWKRNRRRMGMRPWRRTWVHRCSLLEMRIGEIIIRNANILITRSLLIISRIMENNLLKRI